MSVDIKCCEKMERAHAIDIKLCCFNETDFMNVLLKIFLHVKIGKIPDT